MKLITAVITPSEFEAVKKALDIFGITGLTITEVFQRDLTGGRDQIYRGQRFHVDLLPHVRIELITPENDTADLIRIITKLTSPPRCGKNIWITPVETLTRIRTGERGTDAL
ncbi:MAG: P-II family nitrogen regulator [Pseudonocardiales bacterium]|nr:P-II family nitrogen regulator [Pseudonocardiales bacterium]